MDERIGNELSILADVPVEKGFLLKDGRTLKNLKELHDAASDMNDETFGHHVAAEKNDFSNWIRDVYKDEELAKNLEGVKTQADIKRFINDRIEGLTKIKEKTVKEKPNAKKTEKGLDKNLKIKKEGTKTKKPITLKLKHSTEKIENELKLLKNKEIKNHCSHHYFMKCSATHFALGLIAGFLAGMLFASI